jgi:hypothetical protein
MQNETNTIFSVFRLLCANDEDLEKSSAILSGSSVSATNDLCMANCLRDLLGSTLVAYPTSLLYDEMIYKYLDSNSEMQLAVRIRIIEKTILTAVLEKIEQLYPKKK